METIETVVDAVAVRLGRAAVLEDCDERLLAHSRHDAACDQVRQSTILRRRADPAVVSWLSELHIAQARQPLRIPANIELGMLPRVCVPVSDGCGLLGYLWFVDPDGEMTDEELVVARRTADGLATLLVKENLRQSGDALPDGWAQLLEDGMGGVADDLFNAVDDGLVVAAVIRPLARTGCCGPDDTVCVGRQLMDTCAALVPAPARFGLGADHGLLLAAVGSNPENIDRLVTTLGSTAKAVFGPAGFVAGVGGPAGSAAKLATAYRQARHAADTAYRAQRLGSVVRWSRIGLEQAISILADEPATELVPHPALGVMLADPSATSLIETLETYLDAGGAAHAAADRLSLHRATLYYRLQRIEEALGVDLKDGTERLALHLTLKIHRARTAGAGIPREPTPRTA